MKIELDPFKDNGSAIKRNHPSASQKTFSIRWLGDETEHFHAGDQTYAYTDEHGTTYGQSLMGSWIPVGKEGVDWEWVRYNPPKRNPRDFGEEEAYRAAEGGYEPVPSFKAVWNDEDRDGFVFGEEFDADKRYDRRLGETVYYGWAGDSMYPVEISKDSFTMSKTNRNGFKHARPFGGSVGREQYHVHFEDAKGVIYYYAGNTDKGVKLEREYHKAKKFTAAKASALAKKLDRLYKNVRHDGGHFYAESASDVKANGVDTPYKGSYADVMSRRPATRGLHDPRNLHVTHQQQQRLMNIQKRLGTAGYSKEDAARALREEMMEFPLPSDVKANGKCAIKTVNARKHSKDVIEYGSHGLNVCVTSGDLIAAGVPDWDLEGEDALSSHDMMILLDRLLKKKRITKQDYARAVKYLTRKSRGSVKANGNDFSTYTKRDCLDYIKRMDRNGYETLEGDETLAELRDACRTIAEG